MMVYPNDGIVYPGYLGDIPGVSERLNNIYEVLCIYNKKKHLDCLPKCFFSVSNPHILCILPRERV